MTVDFIHDDEVYTVTKRELEALVEGASERGTRKELRDIGLYADTPEEKTERRKDFDHLNKWRRAVERAAIIVGTAVLTIVAGSALAAFWLGLKLHLLKQP